MFIKRTVKLNMKTSGQVFCLVALFFSIFHICPPSYSDTYEYCVYAKNCLSEGICASYGAEYAVTSLYSGALWNKVIVLAGELGVSLYMVHILVMICLSASVVIFYLFVKNYLVSSFAIVATLAFLLISLFLTEYPILWNDSLQPLFMAAFMLFSFRILARGKIIDVAIASISLALLMETHIITLLLLPVLLIFTVVASRHVLLSTVLSIEIMLFVRGLISFDTLLLNFKWVLESDFLPSVIVVLILVFVLGHIFRKYYKATYSKRKNLPLIYIITIYSISSVVLLGLLTNTKVSVAHYEPALSGIAVLWAHLNILAYKRCFSAKLKILGILRSFPSASGVIITSLVFCFWYTLHIFNLPVISGCSRWTIRDMETISDEFHKEGYSYNYLRQHLFAPGKSNIMRALLYHEDKQDRFSPDYDIFLFKGKSDIDDLDVAKTTKRKVGGGKALYMVKYKSWLDMQNATLCFESPTEKRCIKTNFNELRGPIGKHKGYVKRFKNIETSVFTIFESFNIIMPMDSEHITLSIPFKKDYTNHRGTRIYAVADELCRSYWNFNMVQSSNARILKETAIQITPDKNIDSLYLVSDIIENDVRGIHIPSIIELPEDMQNYPEILRYTSKHKSLILKTIHQMMGERAE